MTEALGPMYFLKPVQQGRCLFNYNSKMYPMKNLVESGLSLETGSGEGDRDSDARLYEEVERTQAVIFEYIAAIKKQIEELRRILLKRSVESVVDERVRDVNVMAGNRGQVDEGQTFEVVINADVDSPPYSLLALRHLTKEPVSLNVTSHFHSSLSSLPDRLSNFKEIKSSVDARTILNIRLIWKKGGGTYIVIGHGHLVLAEVGLLRFVHSLLDDKLSPSDNTRLQEALDDINNCENPVLESRVEGTRNLVSDRLTVADVALWSRLKRSSPGKLERWYRHFDQILAH